MRNLKILFTPITSFSEMFTADQLWGQMVWAISDLHGEKAVDEFICAFNDKPPFLISDLLPNGYLASPVLSDTKMRSASELSIAKSNKKCNWTLLKDFASIQKDTSAFFEQHLSDSGLGILKTVSEVHPTISRETNTVVDGGLFNRTYLHSEKDLCVYLRFLTDDACIENTVMEVIDYWKVVGLGGDRNVGHGQFKIRVEGLTEQEQKLFFNSDGNSVMTLSTCFGEDLVPISYKLRVYTGIVGKGNNAQWGYRKKPIIEFMPGSVFASGSGVIAKGVHPEECICSYGLLFPVAINVHK